ncbi:MAG TPA: hypothetical protein VGD31_00425 [Sphingobacteriaceae bacterium]
MYYDDHRFKHHPLFQALRQGITHVTSLQSYRSIRTDGYINPNNGQYLTTHHQSSTSRVAQLGGISLFDFELPDAIIFDDEILHWPSFLTVHKPVNVIFTLRREDLADRLMSNDEIRASTSQGTLISQVEVCYRGQIPVSAITQTIFVCSDQPEIFEVLETPILPDEHVADICLRMKRRLVEGDFGWKEVTVLTQVTDKAVAILTPEGECFFIKTPPEDEEHWYRDGDKLLVSPETNMISCKDIS